MAIHVGNNLQKLENIQFKPTDFSYHVICSEHILKKILLFARLVELTRLILIRHDF